MLPDASLSETIIGCAYTVHKELGSGFLERVYENALAIELGRQGINCESQVKIPVYYSAVLVGDYMADLIVESRMICEIKAVERLHPRHSVQLVNYLTATKLESGLLINFGSSVDVKRKFRRKAE